jgi:CRP/FNR family cyclic AMP-dependent transcriptional regulator
MNDREILRKIPIFATLSSVEIARLAQVTSLRLCRKDEVIFYEDEEGDFFFVIVAGRVKVTLLGIPDRFTRDYGREVLLSSLGPGDFFGEMALVDNEPRSATAVASEETELLCIHRSDFQRVLTNYRGFVGALLRSLTARLRRANQQIATLAILDGYGRTARAILDLAREQGKRRKDGSLVVKWPGPKPIAAAVGTTTATVNRMLKDLDKQGMIDVQKAQIVVHPDFEMAFD